MPSAEESPSPSTTIPPCDPFTRTQGAPLWRLRRQKAHSAGGTRRAAPPPASFSCAKHVGSCTLIFDKGAMSSTSKDSETPVSFLGIVVRSDCIE